MAGRAQRQRPTPYQPWATPKVIVRVVEWSANGASQPRPSGIRSRRIAHWAVAANGWRPLPGGGLLRFHPADGVAHQGSRVAQIQFYFDVTAVRIDGFGTEMKLGGDVPRAPALADELENL